MSDLDGPPPHGPREAELALLLAGSRSRRELLAARIAELAHRTDEPVLLAFLRAQRITLLGATRLRELVPDAVSQEFSAELDDALSAACQRAMLFATATALVTGTLHDAGIRSVALKGSALAEELYGDAALRAYDDIDVLVPAADLDRAVEAVGELGWSVELQPPRDGELPRLHRSVHDRRGALPELELHWRVHWYEGRFAGDLLDRCEAVDGARRPQPLDQLAALLLFYARDGFAGLHLAADIAAWWDRYGSPSVLPALQALAARHPELGEPWRASLAVAAGVAGLPTGRIPPALRPRTRRAVLASRLSNWELRGDPDQILANVALVDGLLAPRRDLGRFVHRQMLRHEEGGPRAQAGLPSRAAPMLDRPVHLAKQVARHAIAFARLRRGRAWSPLPALPPPATDQAARARPRSRAPEALR